MNISRGFLHITYKLYHHLDKLDGVHKSNCLNVFLSVMKYAWKKNGYEAQLRHETIHKDTGLCRTTIKECLQTLNTLNIIKAIRGRSGKTYIVNSVFLKAENTYDSHNTTISNSKIAVSRSPDSRITTTLEETIYINNNVSKIVKGLAGNREKMIEELSKLPVEELKQDKTNVYLCKLALDYKEQYENKTYVSSEKILDALKSVQKNTNSRYKQKKEYNIRNNLNWKGEPIK